MSGPSGNAAAMSRAGSTEVDGPRLSARRACRRSKSSWRLKSRSWAVARAVATAPCEDGLFTELGDGQTRRERADGRAARAHRLEQQVGVVAGDAAAQDDELRVEHGRDHGDGQREAPRLGGNDLAGKTIAAARRREDRRGRQRWPQAESLAWATTPLAAAASSSCPRRRLAGSCGSPSPMGR